jgi:pSer/pThr/pTyr-binding forkhead associated (FHA) protein
MNVKLTVARGGSKGKTVQLRSPETIVGRARGCDVRIPSASVSRRHCRLSFCDGYLVVEDLGSANGTLVNGVAAKRQAVRPGDRLEIGPVQFLVQYHLTAQALAKLRRQEEEEEELVDVEAVDDEPVVDVEAVDVEAVDHDTAEVSPRKVTTKDKAHSRKTKASPEKKEAEKPKAAAAEDNVAVELDGGASWQAPAGGGDIRDILSQLE